MITEIGKNFFMIRSNEEEFHRNIYLKQFIGQDNSAVNMLFDPGTKLDLATLLPLMKEKAGGINQTNLIFLSHQDPDLTANAGTVMASAPKSFLITSVDTWRLVKMYGLDEKRFRSVESFDSYALKLKKSGHRVRFIPARYCHFRGAMMLYDYESKVLFTGDFMGGVNTRKGEGIYANEESWEGIKLFHQLYMPSTRAVRKTVERIFSISPFPEVIAPQHGDVIQGEFVMEFLERMALLQVGIDLVDDNAPEIDLVILGINNFLELIQINFSEVHAAFLERFQRSGDFTSPLVFTAGKVSGLKISPDSALLQIFNVLPEIADPEVHKHLKGMFINVLDQLDIQFQIMEQELAAGSGQGAEEVMGLDDMLE
ncbi:MAG: hypothetical protein KKB30_12395 [Proteobacteria bacterium]|nr:hypothetical protein [Pseudomonadota bacterium]MBU1715273.1 hypothetical protein [Pseudomonadota bacterium]